MTNMYVPLTLWCVLLPIIAIVVSLVYLVIKRRAVLEELDCSTSGTASARDTDALNPDHSNFYRTLNDNSGDQTTTKTIGQTLKDSTRQTHKVVRPAAYTAIVSSLAMTVAAALFVNLGPEMRWNHYWGIPVAALLGFAASMTAFLVYLTFSPLVAVQAILACRNATSGQYASETLSDTAECFMKAQRAALSGNTAMALTATGVFLLVDFSATLISDLLLPSDDYWGSALYIFAASVGAHMCTLVLSSVGSSFSEGIFVSLYKLEAATQHRVDGTLRITANTVQSAVGAQLVICGTILDLHGLSLALLAAGGNHIAPFMRYSTLIAVCGALAMTPLFIWINYTVYDGREIVRRARLSIVALSLFGAGGSIAAIASFSPPGIVTIYETGQSVGFMYLSIILGAIVIAMVSLSVELFSSKFAPLAALHCDIGSASAQNSIISSASVFGFVAIVLFAAVFNTLVWKYGAIGQAFFIVGTVAPVVIFGAVFANFRGVVSSALCYSRTAQMSAVVQDVLESMTNRSDTLESFSHIAAAFTGPVILFNIQQWYWQFYTDDQTLHFPSPTATTQLALVGLALAMATEGFITFLFGRSTMRVCRAVEEAVKLGESRRRLPSIESSIREDDAMEEDDDPLTGDYASGITVVAVYLSLVIVLVIFCWFVGMEVNLVFTAALMYIFFECVRGSAVACLGCAVKNFVVQGGLSNQESAYADVQFAAVQAAASTTPRAAANVISLTLWRVIIATLMIMVPILRGFDSKMVFPSESPL